MNISKDVWVSEEYSQAQKIHIWLSTLTIDCKAARLLMNIFKIFIVSCHYYCCCYHVQDHYQLPLLEAHHGPMWFTNTVSFNPPKHPQSRVMQVLLTLFSNRKRGWKKVTQRQENTAALRPGKQTPEAQLGHLGAAASFPQASTSKSEKWGDW